MRIGIVKPEFGIVGGFELILRHITDDLEADGHRIEWHMVDVRSLPRRVFGIDVPDDVWDRQPEYFKYLSLVDAFSLLRLDECDLVVSTQPPSFAVEHPRHLALFFHHIRMYYDLSDVWIEGGFAPDPALHLAAAQVVRETDNATLRRPRHILAGSEVVKDRLRTFNGLDATVGVFHAGIGVRTDGARPADGGGTHAICVSRHEFPKRTELFVHAMKLLPEAAGVAVGGGNRIDYVRTVDARLSRLDREGLAAVDDRPLWLCTHERVATEEPPSDSNVQFVGHVDDATLGRLYADAFCVVAPAYDEDYGLTAIESMQHGKPLIVCNDGGGLVTFVDDGVNGLVVDPTGPAIAAAVRRLRDDPAYARQLGEGARQTAARYTWKRAMREVRDGIEAAAAF